MRKGEREGEGEEEEKVRLNKGSRKLQLVPGRLTRTGRDDLLSPGNAELDEAPSPEEEAPAGPADIGVGSAEGATDEVPFRAAVDVIAAADEAAPDATVGGAEVSVVTAASAQ